MLCGYSLEVPLHHIMYFQRGISKKSILTEKSALSGAMPVERKYTQKIGSDKSGYLFFFFLNENICCGYSLEAPQ